MRSDECTSGLGCGVETSAEPGVIWLFVKAISVVVSVAEMRFVAVMFGQAVHINVR